MRDGKPVPGLDAADFKGDVTVLNVWASWCVPCHDEAPLLVQARADKRIRIVGINYKDQADNARRFLGRYGNPFAAIGADRNGRASIEWGVYGVPETFVIGRDGRIAYKLIGADHAAESRERREAGDREGAGAAPSSYRRHRPHPTPFAIDGGPMTKTFRGSCRCGNICFEADIDLSAGTSKYNCTYCWKLRWAGWASSLTRFA